MNALRHANTLFYCGTSGLNLPVPISKYPGEFMGKSRLNYYSHLYNSIEINSIFYKLPGDKTVIKWAESVPDDFQFTFKISKTITHAKSLNFSANDLEVFLRTAENIGNKKGCLLAQFPPSLNIDNLNQLQKLVEALAEATQNAGWKIAMEFRNASWYEKEVYELLNEFEIGIVLHDIPTSATPFDVVSGNFVYLRFHGPEPRYRGDYTDDYLKGYAQRIKGWISENKMVYAYFNNTVGPAVKNLQTLVDFLA